MDLRFVFSFIFFILCSCGMAAQDVFPYPRIPAEIRIPHLRARYLAMHYWDNIDFCDTVTLKNADIGEQGFVNYIDFLAALPDSTAEKSSEDFISRLTGHAPARHIINNLIDHYLDDPQSPMRNDRTYCMLLRSMLRSPDCTETDSDRIAFKLRLASACLPGTRLPDFEYKDEKGISRRFSEMIPDYNSEKSARRENNGAKVRSTLLLLYDPECDNCQKLLKRMTAMNIRSMVNVVKVIPDDNLSLLLGIRALPTIDLVDDSGTVLLKDCTLDQLLRFVSKRR